MGTAIAFASATQALEVVRAGLRFVRRRMRPR